MAENLLWLGTDSGNEGDWATAANWIDLSDGSAASAIPANGDTVHFENSSQNVTEGYSQAAVGLAELHIEQSFTGEIGDADNYMVIGSLIVNIGRHLGPSTAAGSGRIKLNLENTADTTPIVTVFNTKSAGTVSTLHPVQLLVVDTSAKLHISNGKVGIAMEAGEVATWDTITLDRVDRSKTQAEVTIGSGVTLETYKQVDGDGRLECATSTSVTCEGGTLKLSGTGTHAIVNANGGKCISNTTGTITTANIATQGTLDFTQSQQSRTAAAINIDTPGTLMFDPGVMTYTNGITHTSTTGNMTIKAQ